jgi:TonB family protein
MNRACLREIRSGLAILMTLFAGAELAVAQSTHQFPPSLSPGEAINAATQAAAVTRTKTGAVDILSDTQGIDFGPYLQPVIAKVRQNWYRLIPASAKTAKGKLAIEFTVLKNGQLSEMKLVARAGDASLDRAAWFGITASNPFPALPTEFKGDHLELRFRFYYNPDSTDLSEPAIKHAVLIQKVADSNPPKYPREALDAKIEGLVRLEGTVEKNGEIKNLKVIEGDKDLAEAAIGAISRWRFHPANKNGKHIDEPVHINVVFRLDGERVRAQVFGVAGELK